MDTPTRLEPATGGKPRLPTALKVVAILFILEGIFAIIDVVVSLASGHINLNFTVLALFAGLGLLALRPGWRTCALVFLWIAMIGFPVAVVLAVNSPDQPYFELLGQRLGHMPRGLALVLAAALFLLVIWQYRVLTRPDVRALFGLGVDDRPAGPA